MPFATIPTPNPFAMIPFLTISTIPIHDDLNDFNDSHWRHSGRFWFPLATIWTIPIPIGDADSYSWQSSTILDDSDPSRRFLGVRTIRDDPKIVTAVQRLFASHSSPICLPSPSPLFGIGKFLFFFFFFTFMFICLGSRTGGKRRIGINGMFSYEDCCCVLFWFAGW